MNAPSRSVQGRTDERLSDADFARLLDFRDGLRRFLRWSESEARRVGLTASQHQLLLAVRGHHSGHGSAAGSETGQTIGPTIGDVAEHLLLRHHSAVELVDRCARAGLVERVGDADDHRVVRLRLTREGEERLALLSAVHLEELSRLRPRLSSLWDHLPADG
jgi:DNA-binding MarR family transcriptional regulator